jgi:hypothetical protein
MTSWFQPIIIWAALPLAFLLVLVTINALATAIECTDQEFDPDRLSTE